ncbi:MAG: PQQ-binding-like beta-propeller repeat protein [Bacteroidetes bacterium]|nr:PQQ-binding-like beta-propeller repeat protein [Bacteroidota bacterium]MBX7128300.1 PQQ-like beta-propeller repeat protein [Flavobacteriales bacterium]MCC6655860.1 PQQ-binding-like beta-propeller repeat protein [Flavobacteriales bacterium]HMU13715.1 PQQ-binding-like beta-propeller repeat protein [Flavobacteriales bacterium]HMZ47999.1 PQQ-binding-like beta-propeller repeat protein [Flavobacteriales bacterium]
MRTILSLLLLCPLSLLAQNEFPTVWQSEFALASGWNATTPDLSYVIGGDASAVEVLDGTTGKQLWGFKFKEKYGVKECEDWTADHDTETVNVELKKEKKGPVTVIHLDYRTGAEVGADQLPARKKVHEAHRSKWSSRGLRVHHSECYDETSGTTISLAYDDKLFKNAMGGRMTNLTVTASGGHAWSTSFEGKVVAHMIHDMLPAAEGPVILNVLTAHGKVLVVYEGITCLDLATGKVLWNTTFDYTTTSVGLKAKQEIGRAAMPLVTADGVYIADLSKGQRNMKKLDSNTGAVLWSADKLDGDDIVSELLIAGGNLIARFGGVVRHEMFVPNPNGGVGDGTYKVEYEFEGRTGLRAYNATTGQAVWNTSDMELADNFAKSECNILSDGGQIHALGEKNIYLFDAATGKVTKQTEYNSKTIGKARSYYAYDGKFLIEGEKGIAAVDKDLALKYATNTGKCLMSEMRGDAFIVWTGKEATDRKEFIRFDPTTGTIMGKLEGCYRPRFDLTGDRFVRFDDEKVIMYRTN